MIGQFLRGVGCFLRGFRTWGTSPGLMLLGALPGLIVGAAFVAAVVGLVMVAPDVAAWMTPFAEAWDPGWRNTVRALVAVGLVAAGVVIGVVTFAAVTLTIGAPFYERIWRATERRCGGLADEVELPFWTSVGRAIADGLRLLGIGILTGLMVFVVGLIPLVGGVVGWTLGALFGGRAITTELTGSAGDARGMSLVERRALLASNQACSVGFGVCAYLMFLIPGGAVIATPAATAGATLLIRELRGEPTERDGTIVLHTP